MEKFKGICDTCKEYKTLSRLHRISKDIGGETMLMDIITHALVYGIGFFTGYTIRGFWQ